MKGTSTPTLPAIFGRRDQPNSLAGTTSRASRWLLILCLTSLAACGSGTDAESSEGRTTATTADSETAAEESTTAQEVSTTAKENSSTTMAAPSTAKDTTTTDAPSTTGDVGPAGSTTGLDDVDGDGSPDPTCGTSDLGGGLVVRQLCTSLAPDLEGGVVATPGSVLTLAGVSYPEIENVDVTARAARTDDGRKVNIFLLGSDTLFDTGQAQIRSTAEAALPGLVAALSAHFPGASITVRGHTDSVGDPAANMTLAQARADAVLSWLVSNGGVPEGQISAAALGAAVPAALETNPDGSVNDTGRQVNRRVEIVVVAA